ncbi:phage tail sheath protein [Pseudoalteromonas luteoviolacea]|uniref:Phage tail sheath protein n=1 Tax=Pseudoalteromonas luteoviolacea TaxID=43657 RepID=A0A023PZQ4_9GAMM|nr:phage tail sheath C-terminal domain-containing protein [Pseudoalteromonas luteoviolacea]AHX39703.1 phage tail sheath protein FI [Pseudoalteromonas luteoviolacea]KID56758.1 phage tail sheath protein [Pseudoalteromonas luteoviolacea]
MPQYKTPDVYVQEKSTLPPSVAEVATAIPAFIGYTTKLDDAGNVAYLNSPTRITSMVEFEAVFGGAYQESFKVAPKSTGGFNVTSDGTMLADAYFFLHQAVSHFFANGGGACYVVSIGAPDAGLLSADPVTGEINLLAEQAAKFTAAITLLNKIDEVTLISCPEAIGLSTVKHYEVQNKALVHAEKRMDRFALVDVQMQADADSIDPIADDSKALRAGATLGLKYGAAYYPYLTTTMARAYDAKKVVVNTPLTAQAWWPKANTHELVCVGDDGTWAAIGQDYLYNPAGANDPTDAEYDPSGNRYLVPETVFATDGSKYYRLTDGEQVDLADGEVTATPGGSAITISDDFELTDIMLPQLQLAAIGDPAYPFSSADVYNQVKAELGKNYLDLPPSPAIAGVMAKTDKDRGVWKAPANAALAQVLMPKLAIDNADQENLNVDATSGKSINAIRTFVGKGTLVWGARTLAGNDNEWRYVSVRRLFNMVEESVQKATHFAVFEPNTPFTWLKLKTMIESYLEGLWRSGAFFGETPEQAFFVNVGLGQTMTEDDINNGLMNIEIGLAAVRPAEFIVLTFSHKSLEG